MLNCKNTGFKDTDIRTLQRTHGLPERVGLLEYQSRGGGEPGKSSGVALLFFRLL